jgi:hypothetical protein
VRSKWHTLVVIGSLGAFTPWDAVVADDNSSAAWPSPAANNSASTNSTVTSSTASSNGVQRKVQELLRQAMVEMEANRFDSARRLARRAAAIGVTVRSAGVRPDQILAEIDRRERDAAAATHTTADNSGRSHKARAIELLDRGLLALDERRFDEAEQCARQAAQLHVTWDKYDYRPENLLNEIHRQHQSVATETAAVPTADPALDARSLNVAANAQPVMELVDPPNEPSSSLSLDATAVNDRQPVESKNTGDPFQHPLPQRPVTPPYAGAAGSSPAEVLLEQAKEDLRAGREELARRRIEQALRMIPGSPQMAARAGFGGFTAASSNRPIGLSQAGVVPNGLTSTGLTGTNPTYAPAAAHQTFFPLNRNQSALPASAIATDVALKPMHDPYLGDEPTTTDKSSPGAQTMREAMPVAAPINPVYLSRRSTPSMDDAPVQRVGYDSASTPATSLPPRVQTSPGAQPISPEIGWLEKMSSPIPGPGMPMGAPSNAPAGAPQRGFNPAPIAPPVSMDSQWAAGRTSYPASNDPAIANSPDQPKPSFFHKVWDALGGD